MENELMEALTKNILQQAKVFLEDADEFYPFGSIIDDHHRIKPISIYFGEEFPDSIEVLTRLESALTEGIKEKKYLAGVIGLDVTVKTIIDSKIQEKSAVELRLFEKEKIIKSYYHYTKESKEYQFTAITPVIQSEEMQ